MTGPGGFADLISARAYEGTGRASPPGPPEPAMFILTLVSMILSFMALLGGAFVVLILLSKLNPKNKPQGRSQPLE